MRDDEEREPMDQLGPSRGIAIGVLLAAPLWAIVLAIAYAILRAIGALGR